MVNRITLRLFNSGSNRKEDFKTLNPGQVKIYVCGVTPYDTTHLGHAFTYISFDVLIRYLRFRGFEVVYTQNVTDIDDDILRKAKEKGKDWEEFGAFWTKRYLEDMEGLNILKPTNYIKATSVIPRTIEIIDTLVKKGFAYKSGGNVYFSVKRFKRYGELSHFNQKQMKILLKERGGDPDDQKKRDPLDFILWQGWKRGEPYWDTPWGKGRPGWHIECSTIINEYLGDQLDIHGGGRDLIFPHHESEIAQSESFTGKSPFSRYFMHTAMVMCMGEKMAKSLGNMIMVSDLLKRHSPNAIRWMLISHKYRNIWEYSEEELEEASLYADKIKMVLAKNRAAVKGEAKNQNISRFIGIMDDDLNTPEALKLLKELIDSGSDDNAASTILGVLGFIAEK